MRNNKNAGTIFGRPFLGLRLVCAALLSLALVSCGAEKVGADAKAFELKNGIPVYYKSVDSTKIATVIICVRGGSLTYSREFSGVEDLLFNLMSRGGSEHSYDDLRRLSHEKHISIGHSALYSGAYLSLSFLSSYLDEGMDALLDCFLNPAFDAEQYNNMMTECDQGLQRMANDPESLLFYTMNKEIYKGHPLASSTSVLPESRENLTRANLRERYNKILDAKRIFVVAAGDIKLSKLRRSLEKSLGKVAALQNVSASESAPGVFFQEPQVPPLKIEGQKISLATSAMPKGSGHIAVAFAIPSATSPDLPAARIAALMYNEPLFNIIRTKYGACYTPSVSGGFSPAPYGTIFLYRVSDMKNAASHIPEAESEFLSSDIEGKLSGYIKKYLSSAWQNQMTCASIASRSANALLSFGDIDGFDKIAAAAKETTAADIRRVFKKYWQDSSKRVFEIEGE